MDDRRPSGAPTAAKTCALDIVPITKISDSSFFAKALGFHKNDTAFAPSNPTRIVWCDEPEKSILQIYVTADTEHWFPFQDIRVKYTIAVSTADLPGFFYVTGEPKPVCDRSPSITVLKKGVDVLHIARNIEDVSNSQSLRVFIGSCALLQRISPKLGVDEAAMSDAIQAVGKYVHMKKIGDSMWLHGELSNLRKVVRLAIAVESGENSVLTLGKIKADEANGEVLRRLMGGPRSRIVAGAIGVLAPENDTDNGRLMVERLRAAVHGAGASGSLWRVLAAWTPGMVQADPLEFVPRCGWRMRAAVHILQASGCFEQARSLTALFTRVNTALSAKQFRPQMSDAASRSLTSITVYSDDVNKGGLGAHPFLFDVTTYRHERDTLDFGEEHSAGPALAATSSQLPSSLSRWVMVRSLDGRVFVGDYNSGAIAPETTLSRALLQRKPFILRVLRVNDETWSTFQPGDSGCRAVTVLDSRDGRRVGLPVEFASLYAALRTKLTADGRQTTAQLHRIPEALIMVDETFSEREARRAIPLFSLCERLVVRGTAPEYVQRARALFTRLSQENREADKADSEHTQSIGVAPPANAVMHRKKRSSDVLQSITATPEMLEMMSMVQEAARSAEASARAAEAAANRAESVAREVTRAGVIAPGGAPGVLDGRGATPRRRLATTHRMNTMPAVDPLEADEDPFDPENMRTDVYMGNARV
jgi:hypothetical protein